MHHSLNYNPLTFPGLFRAPVRVPKKKRNRKAKNNHRSSFRREKMVRWLPLESNPDVMNKFVKNLGLKPNWSFCDVLGLDPALLAMIPQPTCALLLLFPTNDKYHEFKKEQEDKVLKNGQEVSPNVYFMKQTIGNACGTIAIIHSIANNTDVLEFEDGFLKSFIESTKSLSPEQKGAKLETDESISEAHEACAQEGQTEAPSPEDRVDLHFVAIVHKDGCLYELDGTKPFPINHGKTTQDTFLQDAAEVCKEYMKRDPSALNFTVVALSSNP